MTFGFARCGANVARTTTTPPSPLPHISKMFDPVAQCRKTFDNKIYDSRNDFPDATFSFSPTTNLLDQIRATTLASLQPAEQAVDVPRIPSPLSHTEFRQDAPVTSPSPVTPRRQRRTDRGDSRSSSPAGRMPRNRAPRSASPARTPQATVSETHPPTRDGAITDNSGGLDSCFMGRT